MLELALIHSAHVSFGDVYLDHVIYKLQGPELLSKYIGSSEENVRNVFERCASDTVHIPRLENVHILTEWLSSEHVLLLHAS